MNDQPRVPAGSPEGGEFAARRGSESTSVLHSVGSDVDRQLIEVLESVMIDKKLGTPGNPSDDETVRAAADYMSLPDFGSQTMQARHALDDVRHSAEFDIDQVRGLYGDFEARLADGELVMAETTIHGVKYEGEAYRSSATGKVWFLPSDPYPEGFRGSDGVSERFLKHVAKTRTADLNLDADDPDNDYDLVYEVAAWDEDTAQAAWDLLATPAAPGTLGAAVDAAKGSDMVPETTAHQWGLAVGRAHGTVSDGTRTGYAFFCRARPDHMRVIWD